MIINKKLMKILCISASSLIMLGIGGLFNNNVHASTLHEHIAAKSLHSNRGVWLNKGNHYHIKGLLPGAYRVTISGHHGEWIIPDLHNGSKQSRSYIKSLNFGHHNTKRHKHAIKKHHEPAYLWYKNNGKKLYRKYMNRSKSFRTGYRNATNYKNNGDTVLNMKIKNKQYKQGWIIGCATRSFGPKEDLTNGSRNDYKRTLSDFNQSQKFAKKNKTNLLFLSNGRWHNAYNYTNLK